MMAVSVPAAAHAATSPAVADCTAHGRLTHHYTVAQLHSALSQMPADVQEYTNCYAIIQRALLAGVSSPAGRHSDSGTSSSGGSFLPTPVIVVIVLVALAGAAGVALAVRRRE